MQLWNSQQGLGSNFRWVVFAGVCVMENSVINVYTKVMELSSNRKEKPDYVSMCAFVDFEINFVNIYAAVSLDTALRYIKKVVFQEAWTEIWWQTSWILFA